MQNDLQGVNHDFSTLAADLAAGKSGASDLNTLISDEGKLVSDLGSNLTPSVPGQLRDLTNDLTDQAVELAALQVS